MNKLVSIVGPTAIGKTKLSILLAQHFNTEIISCDSRQFYKEMKIGTAIPSQEELDLVSHHFIGHISIFDKYSVGDFEKEAIEVINLLFITNKIVLMVGGSGLYEKAINEGINKFPSIPDHIKEEIQHNYQQKGIVYLQEELKKLDPVSFAVLDINNPVRLIRALEISLSSDKPFSEFKVPQKDSRNFTSIKIGLAAERSIIYERINNRVDSMLKNGFIEEAQFLYKFKNLQPLHTIGYKELFNHFEGLYSLSTAIEEMKKNTRRYAKRQLTWYRKDSNVKWFNYNEIDNIIKYLETLTF